MNHLKEFALFLLGGASAVALALVFFALIPGPPLVAGVLYFVALMIFVYLDEAHAQKTGKKTVLHYMVSWMGFIFPF